MLATLFTSFLIIKLVRLADRTEERVLPVPVSFILDEFPNIGVVPDFKKKLAETMQLLAMDASYAERDLNVGFSGGEKKKAEILQMLTLEPKLAILDETDSGLDVDAVRTVSKGVQLYRERVHGSLLIITHSTRILEALTVDAAHIMEQGVIVKNGDASLVDTINENGFGGIRAD